jgi:hypothetical protein
MPSRFGEVSDPLLPRKASSDVPGRPVPETDTGGQVEHTEATGELWLRNSANCPRNFGRRGAGRVESPCGTERGMAAETRGKRLFTKNTGPCEVVRRGIWTDACPVLER